MPPEIGRSTMSHSVLEWPDPTVVFVVQSALNRFVETACRHIPVNRATVSPDGKVSDPQFLAGAAQVWDALLSHLDGRAGLRGDVRHVA